METVSDFILGGLQKSLQMELAAMKLKDAYSLEDSILKNRDITLPTMVHLEIGRAHV